MLQEPKTLKVQVHIFEMSHFNHQTCLHVDLLSHESEIRIFLCIAEHLHRRF